MEFLESIITFMDQAFLGISLGQFAAAFGVLILTLIGKKILGHVYTRIVTPFTSKTATIYDDLFVAGLKKPLELLLMTAGLFIAFGLLNLPSEPYDLKGLINAALKVMGTFCFGWAIFNMIDLLDHWLAGWAKKTESVLDDQLLPFIRKSLKTFVVMMAIIMIIQNLGYSISGLLASLGIGGLAVALAAKDTLSNIFGSMMIILDRPFKIGDWIKGGEMEGTVEEIGFRSTKIRTFANTLITVPNSIIANLPLDNFSRMPNRRIKLNIGVTYATTPSQMTAAVDKIRTLLATHPAIDQKFFLVNFTDFGASSLDIMVYCFTTTTVWGEYLDARQSLCLQIMECLEELGLEIAFPSRTIYLSKQNDNPLAASENGRQ
ncbi:MAG: mechanosensitive ion channel family protein [Desulfuromonadales bacterium]|nr:mechanosensitive ion channel family protein [Desulfuromonadales bacterium]